MDRFLRFSLVVWSKDKDGKRWPSATPVFFRIKTPLQDFRPPAPGFPQGLWWQYQKRLSSNVMSQMVDQATPIGPMTELSPEYAKRKEKKYPGNPILIASGGMFQGYFDGADHVFEETPQGMRWGNQNPLAGYHFRGHQTPTPLPRRPLGMPPDDFGGALQSDGVRYMRARYRQEGFRMAKSRGEKISSATAKQWGYESFAAAPIMPMAMGI